MPKRSSKPYDANATAFSIVQAVTGAQGELKVVPPAELAKNLTLNPAALDSAQIRKEIMREMGRRGGKKGGKARAKSLSPEQRSAIATKAAEKRWSKKPNG